MWKGARPPRFTLFRLMARHCGACPSPRRLRRMKMLHRQRQAQVPGEFQAFNSRATAPHFIFWSEMEFGPFALPQPRVAQAPQQAEEAQLGEPLPVEVNHPPRAGA